MGDLEGPASLSAKQKHSILEAIARVNIWEGSVSSGKTIASIIAWLRFVAFDAPPSGRLFMVGRTKDTLYRNVLAPILEMLPPGDPSIRYTKGANTAVIFGREVDVLGANDVAAESRIRGATIAGAYVDEGTLLPGEGYWSQLLNRARVPGARLFVTTNPDGPMHWFKAQVIDRAGELGYRCWHFVLEDNPGLTAEYVAQVKAENVGLWYQRNILGLWVLAEGTIWDMWAPDRHLVDDLPDLERCSLAVDYGTAGVFAALLLGVGRHEGRERLYVAREWRWEAKKERRQLTDAEYSRRLRAQLDGWAEEIPAARDLERVDVDPSASSFLTQLHRDGWQRVRGADNDVGDGIREVATLLAADRLLVHRSCDGLVKEIPGYVWDAKKALAGEDAPVKANDHSCVVAGTLVETDRGRVPVERVRRGDRVWTRSGLRRVRWAGRTGAGRSVREVALSSGEVLVATPDHPVWVDGEGWKTVDALRYGDRLVGWQSPRSSFTTASSSAATRSPSADRTGSTSRPGSQIVSAACDAFTRCCGWKLMARSLTATTSTTSTTTRSTTTSPTWSASQAVSTRVATPGRWWRTAGSSLRRLSLLSVLPSGIAAPRAGHGTASTAAAHGKTASPSGAPANSAAPPTRPSSSTTGPGSAPTHVSPHGAGPPASTTSSGPVSVAGQPSPPTATTSAGSAVVRVLSVTGRGRADVWNLTVDGAPEFFASGVLVHNCDAMRYGVRGASRWWRHWIGQGRHVEAA